MIPWTQLYKPGDTKSYIHNYSGDPTSSNRLIFIGPMGTGKSTLARILVKDDQSIYINTSLERNTDKLIETLRNFITNSFTKKQKTIILDEMDSMIPTTQIAISKLMDTTDTTRIICICNYLRKIEKRLIVRCTQIRFNKFTPEVLFDYLSTIDKDQDPGIIKEIAIYSKGDLRKAMNELQYTHLTGKLRIPSRLLIQQCIDCLIDVRQSFIHKVNFISLHWLYKYSLTDLIEYTLQYFLDNKWYTLIPQLNDLEKQLLCDYSTIIQLSRFIEILNNKDTA
jgi:DNA polymerase III delta prime subunit